MEKPAKDQVCWFPFKKVYCKRRQQQLEFDNPPNVYYIPRKSQHGLPVHTVTLLEYDGDTTSQCPGETELILDRVPEISKVHKDIGILHREKKAKSNRNSMIASAKNKVNLIPVTRTLSEIEPNFTQYDRGLDRCNPIEFTRSSSLLPGKPDDYNFMSSRQLSDIESNCVSPLWVEESLESNAWACFENAIDTQKKMILKTRSTPVSGNMKYVPGTLNHERLNTDQKSQTDDDGVVIEQRSDGFNTEFIPVRNQHGLSPRMPKTQSQSSSTTMTADDTADSSISSDQLQNDLKNRVSIEYISNTLQREPSRLKMYENPIKHQTIKEKKTEMYDESQSQASTSSSDEKSKADHHDKAATEASRNDGVISGTPLQRVSSQTASMSSKHSTNVSSKRQVEESDLVKQLPGMESDDAFAENSKTMITRRWSQRKKDTAVHNDVRPDYKSNEVAIEPPVSVEVQNLFEARGDKKIKNGRRRKSRLQDGNSLAFKNAAGKSIEVPTDVSLADMDSAFMNSELGMVPRSPISRGRLSGKPELPKSSPLLDTENNVEPQSAKSDALESGTRLESERGKFAAVPSSPPRDLLRTLSHFSFRRLRSDKAGKNVRSKSLGCEERQQRRTLTIIPDLEDEETDQDKVDDFRKAPLAVTNDSGKSFSPAGSPSSPRRDIVRTLSTFSFRRQKSRRRNAGDIADEKEGLKSTDDHEQELMDLERKLSTTLHAPSRGNMSRAWSSSKGYNYSGTAISKNRRSRVPSTVPGGHAFDSRAISELDKYDIPGDVDMESTTSKGSASTTSSRSRIIRAPSNRRKRLDSNDEESSWLEEDSDLGTEAFRKYEESSDEDDSIFSDLRSEDDFWDDVRFWEDSTVDSSKFSKSTRGDITTFTEHYQAHDTGLCMDRWLEE